jgi:phosphate transport system protein
LPVARYAFNHSFTILDYTALSAGEAYYLRRRSALLAINMPGKVSARTSAEADEITENSSTSAARTQKMLTAVKSKRAAKNAGSLDDLARLALKACLIARDAAFNVRDLLTNSSRMAFLAIKDCEKELDLIERQIDERLPAAITKVNEARARQLLASLKCITDLERIGDLVMSVALRVQSRSAKWPASDTRQLVGMSVTLRDMLDLIHRGFVSLDLDCARSVLHMDKEIDSVCHALFQKHLAANVPQNDTTSFEILLMAQALERAGDHTTNLAEELYSLIEGHSLRHLPKKRASS